MHQTLGFFHVVWTRRRNLLQSLLRKKFRAVRIWIWYGYNGLQIIKRNPRDTKKEPTTGLPRKKIYKKRILAFFSRPTVKKLKRKKIIFKQYNTPFLHLIFFIKDNNIRKDLSCLSPHTFFDLVSNFFEDLNLKSLWWLQIFYFCMSHKVQNIVLVTLYIYIILKNYRE